MPGTQPNFTQKCTCTCASCGMRNVLGTLLNCKGAVLKESSCCFNACEQSCLSSQWILFLLGEFLVFQLGTPGILGRISHCLLLGCSDNVEIYCGYWLLVSVTTRHNEYIYSAAWIPVSLRNSTSTCPSASIMLLLHCLLHFAHVVTKPGTLQAPCLRNPVNGCNPVTCMKYRDIIHVLSCVWSSSIICFLLYSIVAFLSNSLFLFLAGTHAGLVSLHSLIVVTDQVCSCFIITSIAVKFGVYAQFFVHCFSREMGGGVFAPNYTEFVVVNAHGVLRVPPVQRWSTYTTTLSKPQATMNTRMTDPSQN